MIKNNKSSVGGSGLTGIAGEHYISAMLAFQGNPVMFPVSPTNKGWDLMTENGYKIQVKSSCSSGWVARLKDFDADFDYLAIVVKNSTGVRFWIIPRDILTHAGIRKVNYDRFTGYEIKLSDLETEMLKVYENNTNIK